MKTFLLIAPVFVTLATTMPASAEVYPDAGLNRLDDPNYGWPEVIGDAGTTPAPEAIAE